MPNFCCFYDAVIIEKRYRRQKNLYNKKRLTKQKNDKKRQKKND